MKPSLLLVATYIVVAATFGGTSLSFSEPLDAMPSTNTNSNCAIGSSVTGRVLVGANNVPMMKGPDRSAARVLNERASAVMGRPQYYEVSPNNDLDAVCETKDWILIKVVGTDGQKVSWGSGWIEKRYVVKELSPDRRQGLYWDISNSKDVPPTDKAWVRKGALKVLAEDKKCTRVIYGDQDYRRPGYYYVMCSPPAGPAYNVFFQETDLSADARRTFTHPVPFSEEASRKGCEDEIMKRAIHPSTVDIKWFTGYASQITPTGNRVMMQTFSAKNGFGLELTYIARCLITPNGEIEVNISERR